MTKKRSLIGYSPAGKKGKQDLPQEVIIHRILVIFGKRTSCKQPAELASHIGVPERLILPALEFLERHGYAKKRDNNRKDYMLTEAGRQLNS